MSDRNAPPQKAVRVETWGFNTEFERRRGGVPLLGLFLIALGLVLVARDLLPGAQVAPAAFFLVIGILCLLVWARDRRRGALYLGVFITALSLSDLLSGMHAISGPGWGTLFLGIGLLAIALIRASAGGGWGWQLLIGGLFALSGGADVSSHQLGYDLDRLIVPVLIVLLGLLIVGRNMGRRRTY